MATIESDEVMRLMNNSGVDLLTHEVSRGKFDDPAEFKYTPVSDIETLLEKLPLPSQITHEAEIAAEQARSLTYLKKLLVQKDVIESMSELMREIDKNHSNEIKDSSLNHKSLMAKHASMIDSISRSLESDETFDSVTKSLKAIIATYSDQ